MIVGGAIGCQAILGIDDTSFEPDSGLVGGDAGSGDATSGGDGAPPTGDATSTIALSLTPSLVHLVRGSSIDITVNVSGGHSDLAVTTSGLPTGVTAAPLDIAATATTGTLHLTAAASATLGDVPNVSVSSPSATAAKLNLLVQDPSGTLDTTFNSSGIKSFVPTGQTTGATAVAVASQSDGHVLVLTQPASGNGSVLTRLNVDGTIDATFTANIGTIIPSASIMYDLAVGPSDKISIVGNASGFAIIIRLNANGTPDTGFNFTGISGANNPATFGNGTSASGVAILSDGSAVVVGANYPAGSDNGLVLHFLNNGSLDGAFGPAGNGAYIPVGGDAELKRVVVDEQDRIIAVGTNQSVNPGLPFTLRLSRNGTVDSTFGDAGVVFVPSGTSAPMDANDIARQPDAGYVVVGVDQGGIGGENFAGFVSEHGDASPTDSNDSPVNNVERFTGVATQSDAKLLMVGYGGGTFAEETYLYRKLTYKSADSSFNDGGLVAFSTGGMAGDPPKIFFHDVATMPDGRIVVVGLQNGAGALVMRFWP